MAAGGGEGGGASAAAAATAAAAAAGAAAAAAPLGQWGPPPNATGRWYAQFLEAQGDAEGAFRYYTRVADAPSLLRLLILAGDMPGAVALAEAAMGGGAGGAGAGAGPAPSGAPSGAPAYSGGPAAAYLLARHFESVGDVTAALRWYERCGRFNHAVRLAGASGREAEQLALAARAGPATQLAVARSLEARGGAAALARAARLYHTGGAAARAMELCLAAGLWEELGAIAGELAGAPEAVARIPAALLTRTAEGFVARRLYGGAVGLLVAGRRWGEALDMALEHNVPLSEALAEALTPPKPAGAGGGGEEGAPADPALAAALALRSSQLLRLAGALKKQGLYHAACKKYTQAGDKVRAMKALTRSGDTEKVVFFAGVCRSREIFVLAANYLQTQAWHTDAEVLRNIIDFYGKAKAYEALSAFYESCSAVEIDEFRNYEKAAAALREAHKAAGRIKEEAQKETRLMQLAGAWGAWGALLSAAGAPLPLCLPASRPPPHTHTRAARTHTHPPPPRAQAALPWWSALSWRASWPRATRRRWWRCACSCWSSATPSPPFAWATSLRCSCTTMRSRRTGPRRTATWRPCAAAASRWSPTLTRPSSATSTRSAGRRRPAAAARAAAARQTTWRKRLASREEGGEGEGERERAGATRCISNR